MEEYLEVTGENIEELTDLGLAVEIGQELTCDVDSTIYGEDPDVGHNKVYAQVFRIDFDGVDVTTFFDLDAVEESIVCEERY